MNLLDAIAGRASVRSFSATPLTDAEIELLVKAARHAPVTLGKYGQFHLTVIADRELLGEIGGIYAAELGSDFTYGAPALLIVSADEELPRGQRFATAGSIVQNIQLAALELGLGTVYNWAAGSALAGKGELLARLGVPEGFAPLTGVLAGEPADGRLPAELAARPERTEMGVNFVSKGSGTFGTRSGL